VTLRVTHHPLLQIPERPVVEFTFDNQKFTGLEGEPIAVALLAAGVRTLRKHEASGHPRGLYCGIGHCMECRVHVEGMGIVRACLTPLVQGISIDLGVQLDNPIEEAEPR